ncbi:MAG: DUF5985 family protein [Pseudomonadota bacterium]
MSAIVYSLCAFTAFACSVLLLRAYFSSKSRVLLWSGLCFVGLSINNLLLVFDRLIFPSVDFSNWRLISALVALLPLLYGLIWEDE